MKEQTEAEKISEDLVRAFVQFRRLRMEDYPPGPECFHHGIKHSEIMLLLTLTEAEKHSSTGVSVSELSRRLRVKPPSITPTLAGLEKKQMIERAIDPDDRRIVRVHMLEAGHSFILKMWHNIIEKTSGLVEYLGPEKSRELTSLVNESFAYIIEHGRHASQP